MKQKFLEAAVLAAYRTGTPAVLEVMQALTGLSEIRLLQIPPETFEEAIERLDNLGKSDEVSGRKD